MIYHDWIKEVKRRCDTSKALTLAQLSKGESGETAVFRPMYDAGMTPEEVAARIG